MCLVIGSNGNGKISSFWVFIRDFLSSFATKPLLLFFSLMAAEVLYHCITFYFPLLVLQAKLHSDSFDEIKREK